MRDILFSELQRFRLWAGLYALVQTIVLAFLTRIVDLAQQPSQVYLAFAGVHALGGLLLALYQFGGYRRPNAWVNLLHRPLPHWRIALALVGSGAVLIAVAVLLPLLLMAVWQETMTARVVDARHLWLCLAGWNVGVIGYLSGAAAILLPRRCAPAALLLLAVLPGAQASGASALLLQAIVIGWLLALLLVAFKPDLGTVPRRAGALLVAAPLAVTMWLMFVMAGFGFELAWIAQGTHPNNLPRPPAGSAKEADNAEGSALIVAGLAAATHPQAALWREQAAISDIATFGPMLDQSPQWHELMNQAPMEFDDEERRIRWVFSHDTGRFVGYGTGDQQPAGTLGVDGDGRFDSPPLPGPMGSLIGRHTVWQYDGETGRVLARLQAPDGEVVSGVAQFGQRLVLLSNGGLYFHDARALDLGSDVLVPDQRVPLPAPVGNLTRVDVLELLEGYLVSFTYTRGRHNGDGGSYQQLVHVGGDGTLEDVARRELPTGYGPLFTYQTWIVSPAIHAGLGALKRWLAPYQPVNDIAPPAKPTVVLALAGVLAALALLAGLLHVRRTALSLPEKGLWCLACALVGIPALAALWLMHPPREQLEWEGLPARSPQPT